VHSEAAAGRCGALGGQAARALPAQHAGTAAGPAPPRRQQPAEA
jgi:hypothetical protein